MSNHIKQALAFGCVGLLALGCGKREGKDEPQTIEQGLKQAGEAVERGADRAGEAVKRGVDEARPHVERGVEQVGEAVEQGAKKAGPALKEGAQEVGDTVERGVEKAKGALAATGDKKVAKTTFDTGAGNALGGEATFYDRDGKLRVVVNVKDAPPGPHGIHVHEKGNCSDLKGKSMGSHFDLQQHPHGLPAAKVHHLGDLGNIEVGKDGTGELEINVPDASTSKDAKSTFIGKALVIHAGKDDGTGKSGNSGDPIACGVITAVQ